MTGSETLGPTPEPGGNSWQRSSELLWLLLIWGLLLGWSLGRVPIPGVNETHYLTKAKYFWNPGWCSGDHFLASSNPHLVFYFTVGWLTRFLSLEQTAIVSRIAGLLILAIGWQRLGRVTTGSSWGAVIAVPLFAILQVLGNWSGEWLVGGIESKVFGYGFLLWGLGAWLEKDWIRSGALLGLAIAFHPIVGCWGLGSLILAVGATAIVTWGRESAPSPPMPERWRAGLFAILCGIPCALAGIVPALTSLSASTKQESLNADYLQFAGRLSHHLDTLQFPIESHRYFVMQLVVWGLLLMLSKSPSSAVKFWRQVVLGAMLIAAVGLLLAAGPRPVKEMPGWEWRIGLLKFYPFRVADLLLPLAVAWEGSTVLQRFFIVSHSRRLAGLAIIVGLYAVAILVPGSDRNPARMAPDRLERWVGALTWIEQNTDSNDVIYCYDEQYAVRWYAQRAEYVNYKDCPQDAPGLLEWNRRLWKVSEWNRQAYLYGDGLLDAQELASFHQITGVQWLIVSRKIRVQSKPAHQNRDFAVIDLREK